MKTNKLLKLVIGLICVFGLGYYTFKILKKDTKSSTELISFAIEDTSAVTKIIIAASTKIRRVIATQLTLGLAAK